MTFWKITYQLTSALFKSFHKSARPCQRNKCRWVSTDEGEVGVTPFTPCLILTIRRRLQCHITLVKQGHQGDESIWVMGFFSQWTSSFNQIQCWQVFQKSDNAWTYNRSSFCSPCSGSLWHNEQLSWGRTNDTQWRMCGRHHWRVPAGDQPHPVTAAGLCRHGRPGPHCREAAHALPWCHSAGQA